MMNISIKDQAFPDENNYGISMRDYFAARAMQALITGTSMWREEDDIYLARAAYAMADAMLEAREQE
jgi:hypothetical protein